MTVNDMVTFDFFCTSADHTAVSKYKVLPESWAYGAAQMSVSVTFSKTPTETAGAGPCERVYPL